jgi:hypothetical protein
MHSPTQTRSARTPLVFFDSPVNLPLHNEIRSWKLVCIIRSYKAKIAGFWNAPLPFHQCVVWSKQNIIRSGFEPIRSRCAKAFDVPFVYLTLKSSNGSPVPLIKFRIAPRPIFLTSSGSKEKNPEQVCLRVAEASYSHKTRAEVLLPHLLYKGLSISHIRYSTAGQHAALQQSICGPRSPE